MIFTPYYCGDCEMVFLVEKGRAMFDDDGCSCPVCDSNTWPDVDRSEISVPELSND